MRNGKGDDPRNCFSESFKKNFDKIDWRKKPEQKHSKRSASTLSKLKEDSKRKN